MRSKVRNGGAQCEPTFRHLTRAITIRVVGLWKVIQSPIHLNGKVVAFEGEALVTKPGSGHSIKFEVQTRLLQTAVVKIPLLVSSDASLSMFFDNELVHVENIKGGTSGALEVHFLERDVSQWAEPRKDSCIRLLIVYRDGDGYAIVPVEHGNNRTLGPRLVQEWHWRSSLLPILFLVIAWGCVLGVAILAVSTQHSFGDKFRYYAVLTLIATWICGILGLPDLAKIPIQQLLRRLYGVTRPHRIVSLFALLFVLLALSFPAGRFAYCLAVRQRYANLIEQALSEEQRGGKTIRDAFVLLPWRKEAQALFELSAYRARPGFTYTTTQVDLMEPYWDYVGAFARDHDVQAAIEKVRRLRKPSCCLSNEDISTYSDPVIWYASILPESEKGDAGVRTSIEYLSRYRGANQAEAGLLSSSLQLYLEDKAHEDTQALDTGRRLWSSLLRAREEATEETFTFQLASDYLGSYYASICKFDSARELFQKEIRARELLALYRFRPQNPLWGRPPQKLLLPYMFLLSGSMKGQNVSADSYFMKAQRLLDGYGLTCDPPFREEFEKTFLNSYPSFQRWEAWLKGTLLDPDIKIDQYINQSLNEGWRY